MTKNSYYNNVYCKNCKNRYVKLTSLNDCNIIHITVNDDYNEITCKDSKGNIIKNKIKLAMIIGG